MATKQPLSSWEKEADAAISYAFRAMTPMQSTKARVNSNGYTIPIYGSTENSSILDRLSKVLFPKPLPALNNDMLAHNTEYLEYKKALEEKGLTCTARFNMTSDNDVTIRNCARPCWALGGLVSPLLLPAAVFGLAFETHGRSKAIQLNVFDKK